MERLPFCRIIKNAIGKGPHEPCNHTERPCDKSVVDRIDTDDRNLHGIAGYQHRERLASPHCRRARNQSGRSDLGPNKLPRGKRGCSPSERLAEPRVRPKEVLYGLRSPVHREFFLMRDGAKPRAPDFFPSSARHSRWRFSSIGTGHAGGYLSTCETRRGFWTLQYGDRTGSGTWADIGRLDHRQFFLALDFFH